MEHSRKRRDFNSAPCTICISRVGNPEEGELRPQLLDRFGMHSEIRTVRDPELRVQIVEQRSSFDKNPQECLQQYSTGQEEFRQRIIRAQEILRDVSLDLRSKSENFSSMW